MTAVLAVAGALITMAGVAMLLVLAAQHGWFGPGARVAAGAGLAGLLVALGVRGAEADRRTDRGVVGSAPVALVATGAAAAYLDVVAVTSGYGWVSPAVGFALAGAVALGGLHLARRWGSELLAVLMVLGAAALAPFVAQGGGWVVSAFLGVLCVAGWWAGGPHTRPALTVVRVVPVTLSLLVGAATEAGTADGAVGQVAVAAVVLAATLVTSTLSVRRDAHDVTPRWRWPCRRRPARHLGTLTGPGTAWPSSARRPCCSSWPRSSAGRRSGRSPGTWSPRRAPAGTVFAVFAVVAGAPERFVTTGLLLLALAGSPSPVPAGRGPPWRSGPGPPSSPCSAGHRTPRHRHRIGRPGRTTWPSRWSTASWSAASWRRAVVHRLAARARARASGSPPRCSPGCWGWRPPRPRSVSLGTLIGTAAGEPSRGSRSGTRWRRSPGCSPPPGCCCAGLERSRDADLTLRTGLLLGGICVAKLFLFDLAALSGLVRSVAFIVTGLFLLATGSRYAKAYERRRIKA